MSYLIQRSRSAWLHTALVIGLLTACSTAPVQEPQPPESSPAAKTAPARIQKRIALPRGTRAVAFGDQAIWISNPAEQQISRIDLDTGQAADPPMALDFAPQELAYGAGSLWVCSADRSHLARIDSQTHKVVALIDLRALNLPTTDRLLMAVDERAIWLVSATTVFQVDPQTNRLVGQPLTAGEEIIAIAMGHGSLWTGSHDDGIVTRIDSATQRVLATIDVGFAVHGLAVGAESAWVLDEHGFAVVRIDPQSNQLRERIPIDFVAANLAAGAESVWVAPAARDSGQPTGNDGIARIDEQARRIEETIHVGDAATSEYYALFFAEGSAWVWIDAPEQVIVQITP